VSSNEPVKNGCEVIYEIFHILNCGFEIKRAMMQTLHARAFVPIVTFQIFHLRFWTCLQILWTYRILLIFYLALWLIPEIILQDLIQRRVHRSVRRKQTKGNRSIVIVLKLKAANTSLNSKLFLNNMIRPDIPSISDIDCNRISA